MPDTQSLIDQIARASVEAGGAVAGDYELAAVLTHGDEARQHVWDRHYANATLRVRLAERLAASTPEFQAAVAATERVLADELAADNERRARVRAENPDYFKD